MAVGGARRARAVQLVGAVGAAAVCDSGGAAAVCDSGGLRIPEARRERLKASAARTLCARSAAPRPR